MPNTNKFFLKLLAAVTVVIVFILFLLGVFDSYKVYTVKVNYSNHSDTITFVSDIKPYVEHFGGNTYLQIKGQSGWESDAASGFKTVELLKVEEFKHSSNQLY